MKKTIALLGLLSLLSISGCKKADARKKNNYLESERIEYALDEENNWYIVFKFISFFDENMNLTKRDIYKVKYGTKTLEYYGYETYTFDKNKNLVEMIEYLNDDVKDSRHVYNYDSNNRLTEYTFYDYFDDEKNEWVGNTKDTYKYNGNNASECISYLYDDHTEKWDEWWKTTYKYDKKNNVIERKEDFYDDDKANWVNRTKSELEYDNSSNNTLTKEYDYDAYESKWNLVAKTEKEFDDKGSCIKETGYQSNNDGQNWVIIEDACATYSYTYDSYGNVIGEEINNRYGKKKIELTLVRINRD